MNAPVKFPRNQGGPISVRRGKSEQARWKANGKNKNYTDTFPVLVEVLQKFTQVEDSNGIEFCNGCNNEGVYEPIMAAVNGSGKPLVAFNNNGEVPLEEFYTLRENWNRFHEGPETPQFFYLGNDIILENIEDFDIIRYEAAFVEKADGTDSAVLFGYSGSPTKDGGVDDPDTCLNKTGFCPPVCNED